MSNNDLIDPVTGAAFHRDDTPLTFRRKPAAEPERGTINHAGRAEKFILDMPGRRYEPGCAEEVEKDRPPKIRG